eukprot:3801977-Pyramimonas_sp.AAC.1
MSSAFPSGPENVVSDGSVGVGNTRREGSRRGILTDAEPVDALRRDALIKFWFIRSRRRTRRPRTQRPILSSIFFPERAGAQ